MGMSSRSLSLPLLSFSFQFSFSAGGLGENYGEGGNFCFVGVKIDDCLLSTINVCFVGVFVCVLFYLCFLAFVMGLVTVVLFSE